MIEKQDGSRVFEITFNDQQGVESLHDKRKTAGPQGQPLRAVGYDAGRFDSLAPEELTENYRNRGDHPVRFSGVSQ